jgi:hypothetical protein
LFKWGYGPVHIASAMNVRKNNTPSSCDTKVVEKTGGALACHPTNHLILHENDSFGELLGVEAVIINPDSYSANANQSKEYDP